eukprot:1379102-Amorphochlora_amoeboformis.AAC.1
MRSSASLPPQIANRYGEFIFPKWIENKGMPTERDAEIDKSWSGRGRGETELKRPEGQPLLVAGRLAHLLSE